MSAFSTLRGACACAALALASTSADAQLFRTYVASDGSDANPCTLPAPCRLLPAALAAVADGGEIWMLDSANFNSSTVTIAKSVTILAIPGALGSVVATGSGHGITIDAPSVRVTLRNLVIVKLGNGLYGVNFVQGAQLNVIGCEVNNVNSAIHVEAPGSELSVKDSVFRNGVAGVLVEGTVTASIDNLQALNNSYGVYAGGDSRVTVSNSVLSGNLYGAYANATSGTARLVVRNSTMAGNGTGIRVSSTNAASVAQVTAIGNTIANNTYGVYAFEGASATATVVLDGNAIAENSDSGVNFASGAPVVYSRGNNTFRFNGADLVGGALTAISGQ